MDTLPLTAGQDLMGQVASHTDFRRQVPDAHQVAAVLAALAVVERTRPVLGGRRAVLALDDMACELRS